MAAAALALAASGLPVFGLVPRGKVPHRGSHGHLDATLDAAAIAEHWCRHPYDNIGVRPPADMFVLDVDPRHGGHTQLARLIAHNGPLPRTWTARTGSGGRHYWFTTDVDAIKPTLCSGVDIKTSAGFAVAPPSIHRNGTSYEWLTPAQRPACGRAGVAATGRTTPAAVADTAVRCAWRQRSIQPAVPDRPDQPRAGGCAQPHRLRRAQRCVAPR